MFFRHFEKAGMIMQRNCIRAMRIGLLCAVLSLGGCAPSAYNQINEVSRGENGDYCHKVLRPVGPTDPARSAQREPGDFIDYYGACDGPSRRDQLAGQRRFEQFRFGRDYIDE